jgi:hypothetical protein
MGKKVSKEDHLLAVLDPRGVKREEENVPLAPRVPDFNGKVVYCLSQYIGGADIFLKKVADALPQYIHGVKTIYKRKPSAYSTDDPDLWDEIKKEANAVIYGCGA